MDQAEMLVVLSNVYDTLLKKIVDDVVQSAALKKAVEDAMGEKPLPAAQAALDKDYVENMIDTIIEEKMGEMKTESKSEESFLESVHSAVDDRIGSALDQLKDDIIGDVESMFDNATFDIDARLRR